MTNRRSTWISKEQPEPMKAKPWPCTHCPGSSRPMPLSFRHTLRSGRAYTRARHGCRASLPHTQHILLQPNHAALPPSPLHTLCSGTRAPTGEGWAPLPRTQHGPPEPVLLPCVPLHFTCSAVVCAPAAGRAPLPSAKMIRKSNVKLFEDHTPQDYKLC